MHIVLKRGSIDKPLTFNNGLYTTTHFSYLCVHLIHMHARCFQSKYIVCQIPPRVCTLVLFINFAVIKDCMYIFITAAPEVVTPPSSVTIFSGNTAEFTCHVRNAHYATWRLNGTIVGEHNTTNDLRYDANAHQKGTIVSGVSTILTIKAKPKYTGLVIQCVTGDRQGTTEVTSDNATLMVQGIVWLRLVGCAVNMYIYVLFNPIFLSFWS